MDTCLWIAGVFIAFALGFFAAALCHAAAEGDKQR